MACTNCCAYGPWSCMTTAVGACEPASTYSDIMIR